MLLLSGMFDAESVLIISTILQLVTLDAMRGRVSSLNTMFVSSPNVLGDFESGVMVHWFGIVRAFPFFIAQQLLEFDIAEKRKKSRI